MLDVIIVVLVFLLLFIVLIVVIVAYAPFVLVLFIVIFVFFVFFARPLRRAFGGTVLILVVVILGSRAACAAIALSRGALTGLSIVLVVGVGTRVIEVAVVFRVGVARDLVGGARRHFDRVVRRFCGS